MFQEPRVTWSPKEMPRSCFSSASTIYKYLPVAYWEDNFLMQISRVLRIHPLKSYRCRSCRWQHLMTFPESLHLQFGLLATTNGWLQRIDAMIFKHTDRHSRVIPFQGCNPDPTRWRFTFLSYRRPQVYFLLGWVPIARRS